MFLDDDYQNFNSSEILFSSPKNSSGNSYSFEKGQNMSMSYNGSSVQQRPTVVKQVYFSNIQQSMSSSPRAFNSVFTANWNGRSLAFARPKTVNPLESSLEIKLSLFVNGLHYLWFFLEINRFMLYSLKFVHKFPLYFMW